MRRGAPCEVVRWQILGVGDPDPAEPVAVGIRGPAVRRRRHLPERRAPVECRRAARPGGHLVAAGGDRGRSEEHTSELQSLAYLVCRLLLEKKKMQFLRLTVE